MTSAKGGGVTGNRERKRLSSESVRCVLLSIIHTTEYILHYFNIAAFEDTLYNCSALYVVTIPDILEHQKDIKSH
jgi:hypothetical protein